MATNTLISRRLQSKLPKLQLHETSSSLIGSNKQLAEKLEKIKDALVGLEYIFELKTETKEVSSYACCLCEQKGSYKILVCHLSSERHRLNYLKSHFPKLAQSIESSKISTFLFGRLLLKLSLEIEGRLGRALPSSCAMEDFVMNQDQFLHLYTAFIHQQLSECDCESWLMKSVNQHLGNGAPSPALPAVRIEKRPATSEFWKNFQLKTSGSSTNNVQMTRTLKRSSSEPVVSVTQTLAVSPPRKLIKIDECLEMQSDCENVEEEEEKEVVAAFEPC